MQMTHFVYKLNYSPSRQNPFPTGNYYPTARGCSWCKKIKEKMYEKKNEMKWNSESRSRSFMRRADKRLKSHELSLLVGRSAHCRNNDVKLKSICWWMRRVIKSCWLNNRLHQQRLLSTWRVFMKMLRIDKLKIKHLTNKILVGYLLNLVSKIFGKLIYWIH